MAQSQHLPSSQKCYLAICHSSKLLAYRFSTMTRLTFTAFSFAPICRSWAIGSVFALVCLMLGATLAVAQNRVFLAGRGQNEVFHTVFPLSDQSVLIGGSAADLSWLPANTPVFTLTNTGGVNSQAAGRVAFLLHVSTSLDQVFSVVKFPDGTASSVSRIRTNALPGQPTGDLFISGERTTDVGSTDGYYIAKLSANFVNGIPDSLVWSYNAVCPPRGTAPSDLKTIQPWDVGGDGRVVVGAGESFGTNWADIKRLDPDGNPEVVPEWLDHWVAPSGELYGPISEMDPALVAATTFRYSAIPLKPTRRGSMRSYTQRQYDSLMLDENGNPGRKGLFPDDYYFSGPCPLTGGCAGASGYTGYRMGPNPVQRLGGIAVDRRTGDIYYGYSTQTILPGGLPDFEPAVVAMYFNGKIKWWARLYQETNDNSTPDQYVDAIEIDYNADRLVVGARCHGNNVINLWSGNNLNYNPGARGFQNRFTGNNGNIHISWLGKYDLSSGQILNATYVAEFIEGNTSYGTPYSNFQYRRWPNFNAGNPNVNTTRLQHLHVTPDGRVVIAATGRRTFTTANAFQSMPLPTLSSTVRGTWNSFVRIYTPDLSEVTYSSLLTGVWDTLTGSGGDNSVIRSVVAYNDQLLVVGRHRGTGNNLPITGTQGFGAPYLMGPMAFGAVLWTDTSNRPLVSSPRPVATGTGLMKLVPNPATDKVLLTMDGHLGFKASAIASVQVTDLTGKVVMTKYIPAPWLQDGYQLDIKGLVAGCYMVQVSIDGAYAAGKRLVVN